MYLQEGAAGTEGPRRDWRLIEGLRTSDLHVVVAAAEGGPESETFTAGVGRGSAAGS